MNDSKVNAILKSPMRAEQVGALSATQTFIWRSIQKLKTDPSQLLFDAIVSVASMLIFTYLFGGAIGGSPKEYVQFLLPGILLMTVLPMTAYTGAGLCNDIATGVFDRFRTLGFWQPAAVVGALLGDILRYF
ncbi:MAG TPA: ABC transporter permease, partial [Bacillota bacterium]|nr:ABC transporter permease [Bacillota bacterium]